MAKNWDAWSFVSLLFSVIKVRFAEHCMVVASVVPYWCILVLMTCPVFQGHGSVGKFQMRAVFFR